MSTRELFEMASLDVLGLLDDEERAAFEQSFRAADPATQAQIRREQRRFAELDRSLPDVEPPAGLRARVVSAVREAIASVRTEPIGRIGPGSVAMGFNSAPIWRAACIGFATASMVLAGFSWKVQRDITAIGNDLQGDRILNGLTDIGGADLPNALAGLQTRIVNLVPVAAAPDVPSTVHGRLFYDPQRRSHTMLCQNLPLISGQYTVVVDRGAGQPLMTLAKFEAVPNVTPVEIDGVSPDLLDKIQIRRPGEGPDRSEVVLVAGKIG